jgi:hypothetical protein
LGRFNIAGADDAVAEMQKQLTEHLQLVRSDVLPTARDDFRLPPELCAFDLELAFKPSASRGISTTTL